MQLIELFLDRINSQSQIHCGFLCSRIWYNTFVLMLFIFFIVEMCVVMMNLIIGLAIRQVTMLLSNIMPLKGPK